MIPYAICAVANDHDRCGVRCKAMFFRHGVAFVCEMMATRLREPRLAREVGNGLKVSERLLFGGADTNAQQQVCPQRLVCGLNG